MVSTAYIHIVEDDDAVRDSLLMMLEANGHKVQTYACAEAFLAEFSQQLTGCIVLDIRMPGMNGMELQKTLNALNSMLPIIFVTGHGDVPMAVEAMQLGAVDFIQKPYREDELLNKISQAMALDRKNRNSLQQRQAILDNMQQLTPREQDVLQLIVKGKANKVIAIDLNISQRTVEIHRSRVMAKLSANSLAHLVSMCLAVEADLVQAD